MSSTLVYLTLPVELQRDRLPSLTIPKPTNHLLELKVALLAMEIFILWWLWLILVLKIAFTPMCCLAVLIGMYLGPGYGCYTRRW